MDDDPDIREQVFHNAVREFIIFLLLFILLYSLSWLWLSSFRKKAEKDDYYSADDEDVTVYRISFWMCTFSLAISLGTVFLLPISIVSNEVLLLYPNSYYVQWLNASLIDGLWNQIFLFSNLSLFVLLPFAYFFTESEGFAGSKKGLRARFYETFVVLVLLALLIFGLAYLVSAIFDRNTKATKESLFRTGTLTNRILYSLLVIYFILDFWHFYLPVLYSCISLLGVLMLLICTPLGFARLFTVISSLLVKPKFLEDLDEEYYAVCFEEEDLRRKLKVCHSGTNDLFQNGENSLKEKLIVVEQERKEMERRRAVSSWHRSLLYPFIMLLLLSLTTVAVLMVINNMLQLVIGFKTLPTGSQEFGFGNASLSALGPIGAALEIVLILYFMSASLVGFYSVPFFQSLKPRLHDTPMTILIGNCAVLLILSSALPVLSRTLGITNFDLLGDFGEIDWLGNFHIVLFYNVIFTVATALCLVTKFTATMRRELLQRLEVGVTALRRQKKAFSINGGLQMLLTFLWWMACITFNKIFRFVQTAFGRQINAGYQMSTAFTKWVKTMQDNFTLKFNSIRSKFQVFHRLIIQYIPQSEQKRWEQTLRKLVKCSKQLYKLISNSFQGFLDRLIKAIQLRNPYFLFAGVSLNKIPIHVQ